MLKFNNLELYEIVSKSKGYETVSKAMGDVRWNKNNSSVSYCESY